jgi:acetolactate synthase small subunit
MNSVALSRYADRPKVDYGSNLPEVLTPDLIEHIKSRWKDRLILTSAEHYYLTTEIKSNTTILIEELEVVDKNNENCFDRAFIEKVKQQKFDDLKSYLNPENNFTYNKDDVINDLKNYESQFGKILEFRLFGFKYTSADTKPILTIFGAMIRDVQYTEIKISINPKSEKTEVMAVKYDW